MSNLSYPEESQHVVSVLADICRHQNRSELVELLDNAHAYFDFVESDNWNGGTTFWALRLEIPTALYVSVRVQLAEIETEFFENVRYLNRKHQNDPLREVIITPPTSSEVALGKRMDPSHADLRRLWKDKSCRLFLSHVSSHKENISRLKDSLGGYGISAFVAHEDIEPSQEWQSEIALALRSMHAISAIITDDFHASEWTDQEVGWALGRDIPVIPVQLGVDTYGFIEKFQAIRGSLAQVDSLASSIVQSLLRNARTRIHMRGALVEAFERSSNVATSQLLKNVIITIDDFSDNDKTRLRRACEANHFVSQSSGVVDAMNAAFGWSSQTSPSEDSDVPF